MNNNTPRTHACIALGPAGNCQGLLKYFDPATGKLVIRRIIEQLPWRKIMIKRANWWGRKSKELTLKGSIKFINCSGKRFNWDNDELSELEVKED